MKYTKISGFSDEIAEDVETQFQVLRKLHMNYFDPRGIDGKSISDLSDAEVVLLKEKMEACGIRVSSLGSPIGKVYLEEDFEAHFRLFQRTVEIARQLETKYIRIFSFYHTPQPDMKGETYNASEVEWPAQERAEVLDRLHRMVEYARQQDVVLLHENEKEIYGDTADRCLDLMRELGCGHFRAVFDPANFVQCGQDTREAYEKLKEHIACVHVKDAMLADGTVVPAGRGDGNVAYLLEHLFRNGFEGYLSLEPHLGSFSGLAQLELGNRMMDLPQGGEGTFTLAYRALEDILERVL